MLWHIQIEPAPGHPDRLGDRLALEAVESGFAAPGRFGQSGFLDRRRDFRDRARAGGPRCARRSGRRDIHDSGQPGRLGRPGTVVHVMPKPGVTDPEAESALALLRNLDYAVSSVRTIRTYRIKGPAELCLA